MAVKQFGPDSAINEGSSAQYSCTFNDPTGMPINSAAVSAIKATLADFRTGQTINSRNDQSVLGANGGTLGLNGAFTLVLGAADTVAIGTQALQVRRLTLKVTYTTGVLTHEVQFHIQSLVHIT